MTRGEQPKVQLVGDLPLPNGQQRYDIITLTVEDKAEWELPCGCCGASVPISWDSLDADSWRGVGRCSACARYVESYQSDIGFPWAFVSYVLGAGAVPGGRAGAGAGRELATASRQPPSAGFRHCFLD